MMVGLPIPPTFTTPNPADLRFRYPEASGDAVFALLRGSNFFDLFGGEFGLPCGEAKGQPFCLSPLSVPVNSVVFVRPEEQVIDIHAMACVAGVTNTQPSRNRTICVLPCQSVRATILPPPGKNAIPTFGQSRRPQNAPRRSRSRIVRQPFCDGPFARDKGFSVRLHSLNCSKKAIAGQGRTSRVNANRPAFYSTTTAIKAIGIAR